MNNDYNYTLKNMLIVPVSQNALCSSIEAKLQTDLLGSFGEWHRVRICTKTTDFHK